MGKFKNDNKNYMSRSAQLTEQLSLALPYEVIEKLATRQNVRDRKEITHGGRESWNIPFTAIELRENFNTRYDYSGIEELAQSILSQGLLEPLYVDVLANGKIYVERGHRRYYAIKHILDNNLQKELPDGSKIGDFSTVESFINKSTMTEKDRILNLFGTNMHSKELKPLEQAETAYRLKYCLGDEMSNEDIASKLAISRQTVDNLITIASAPDDIKTQIRSGDLSFTAALTLIKSKKKLEKQAAKKEEEAGQSNMYTWPGYQDPLKDEMEGLEALDLQAQRHEQAEKENARKEAERLERDAVIVPVKKDLLTEYIGKRLAAPAYFICNDEGADNGLGGEVVVPRKEIVFEQGKEITEALIDDLVHKKVETVFVFKEIQASPSVITQLPEMEPEKQKFDSDRIEIAQIQNIIKLSDRISVRVEKLEVSDGDKKDLMDWCKWLQKDSLELRDWIHANKKNLKRDR